MEIRKQKSHGVETHSDRHTYTFPYHTLWICLPLDSELPEIGVMVYSVYILSQSQEMRFMKPELNKYLWNELYQWTESFLIVSENNLTFS